MPNQFLAATSERTDLNQYWFSSGTVAVFVDEIVDFGGRAALVSTPSIYFSLPEGFRESCMVFDYDRQWAYDPGYVFYDFNEPEAISEELHGLFDFVLVDPPFISREAWAKYAVTTKLLLKEGGRVLCTTIAENVDMMHEFLGLQPVLFRPSIPNLVYQYSVFANYTSGRLSQLNSEIDDEDWRPSVTAAAAAVVPPEEQPKQMKGQVSFVPLEIKQESSQATLSSGEQAILIEEATQPHNVQILMELREKLNTLKRSLGALNVPLQTAVRARKASGEAATLAVAKGEAALDVAEAAVADLADWVQRHNAEIIDALSIHGEAFTRANGKDMWRTEAIQNMLAEARGDNLCTLAAYKEFVRTNNLHSAALFRLGQLVLDRMKDLKRGMGVGIITT